MRDPLFGTELRRKRTWIATPLSGVRLLADSVCSLPLTGALLQQDNSAGMMTVDENLLCSFFVSPSLPQPRQSADAQLLEEEKR